MTTAERYNNHKIQYNIARLQSTGGFTCLGLGFKKKFASFELFLQGTHRWEFRDLDLLGQLVDDVRQGLQVVGFQLCKRADGDHGEKNTSEQYFASLCVCDI